MIGIERLHKLIADIDVSADPELWYILREGTEGGWGCEEHDDKTLGSTLAAIADQIEREQGGRVSRMRVLSVVTDMERHCLGHEGMEDSPVARWARELREALGGDGRDPAADVSVSAYDLRPQEDREAIAWVREYGGLERVKQDALCWNTAENIAQATLDWLARVCPVAGIEKCGYGVALEKLEAAMHLRLMPEGIEWPRYESGDPVMLGDSVTEYVAGGEFEVRSIEFRDGVTYLREGFRTEGIVIVRPGERVKRPAVPASDGEPLEVGQTVWDTNGDELVVGALEDGGRTVTCRYADVGDGIPVHGMWSPSDLTHHRPVLDADGNRIEPAMDVWWVCEGDERGVHAEKLHVESIGEDGLVTCDPFNGGTWVELEPSELYVKKPALDADGVLCREGDEVWEVRSRRRREIVGTHYRDYETGEPLILCDGDDAIPIPATCVTHTKPESPDSWDALWDDIEDCAVGYESFMRRCRALAERERGE